MDKGYDSEAIHRLIREDLHANSVIPIRSWNNECIGGTYRQEMAQWFDDVVYPRRQLVENKFSVLKRKFSGDLKARRFRIQMKEIANKMIVCNIHRFLLFLLAKVFYRAHFFITCTPSVRILSILCDISIDYEKHQKNRIGGALHLHLPEPCSYQRFTDMAQSRIAKAAVITLLAFVIIFIAVFAAPIGQESARMALIMMNKYGIYSVNDHCPVFCYSLMTVCSCLPNDSISKVTLSPGFRNLSSPQNFALPGAEPMEIISPGYNVKNSLK